MILPIGDDQIKGGYFPYVSYTLIALNVIVFLFQATLSPEQFNVFVIEYGSIPAKIIHSEDWFTLFTSMFLHGSWMHLIGNMLFLWIFADNIEATIGNIQTFLFYILGGLAAHAAHIYFSWGSAIPTVGASGAISAVMGAYLVLFPTSKIKMLALVFVIRVPAFLFLGFWIFQQWSFGSQSLGSGDSAGVAWWAHIGGFVFGVLAGVYFRANYPKVQPPIAGCSYSGDLL